MKPGLLLAGLWLFIDSFFFVSAVGHGSLTGPGTSAMPDLQARAYPLPLIAPPPSPGGTGVLLKPPALGGFLPALAPPPGNRITVAGPSPVPWPSLAAQPLQAAGAVKPIQPGAAGFMLGQWGAGGGTGAGSPTPPPLLLATAGNPSGGSGGGGGTGSPGGGGGTGGAPGIGSPGGGNPGGGNPGGGAAGGSPPVTLGQGSGLPLLVPTGITGPTGGAAPLPAVAPVPLPAAGIGLAAALAALAGVHRRRSA